MNAAEAWNANHVVGTRVVVRLDRGGERVTKTTSAAWMLGETEAKPGHTPVVLLQGISGAYLLDRVAPLLPDRSTPAAQPAAVEAPASRDLSLPDPRGWFEARQEGDDWGIFWGDRQVGELFPDQRRAEEVRSWLAASWSDLEELAIGLQRGAS